MASLKFEILAANFDVSCQLWGWLISIEIALGRSLELETNDTECIIELQTALVPCRSRNTVPDWNKDAKKWAFPGDVICLMTRLSL